MSRVMQNDTNLICGSLTVLLSRYGSHYAARHCAALTVLLSRCGSHYAAHMWAEAVEGTIEQFHSKKWGLGYKSLP